MVNTQVFEWSSVKETTFDLKAYLSERRSLVEAALEQSITLYSFFGYSIVNLVQFLSSNVVAAKYYKVPIKRSSYYIKLI